MRFFSNPGWGTDTVQENDAEGTDTLDFYQVTDNLSFEIRKNDGTSATRGR